MSAAQQPSSRRRSPEAAIRSEAWRWTWLVVCMLWVVYSVIDFAGWGMLACAVGFTAVAAYGVFAVVRRRTKTLKNQNDDR